jgi:hypothetical protein
MKSVEEGRHVGEFYCMDGRLAHSKPAAAAYNKRCLLLVATAPMKWKRTHWLIGEGKTSAHRK